MSAGAQVLKILRKMKGMLIAAAVVLIIILGLWAYSGIWPPLVVIESSSMQHSQTASEIGVIDTGDLVIIKKVSGAEEVTTYLEGMKTGHQTYGEYGDVVIYKPYGQAQRTSIIHRAFARMIYNQSGGYDIPALKDIPQSSWSVSSGQKVWYNLNTQVSFFNIGYNQVTVKLNLTTILNNFQGAHLAPHSGIITLGDNNHGIVDQSPMANICWAPIKSEWVQGEARGELPWFGLLKLWITGPSPDGPVPENSKTNLFISIGLIIAVPLAIDVTGYVLNRKGIDLWGGVRKKLGLKPRKSDEEGPAGSQPSAEKENMKEVKDADLKIKASGSGKAKNQPPVQKHKRKSK